MPGGRTPLYQPGQSLYHIPGLITFDQDNEGDLESSYDTSPQQSQVQRTVLNDLNSSRENALQTPSRNLGKGSSDDVILLQKQQHMFQKLLAQQENMQTQQENIKRKQIELEQKFGAFEQKLEEMSSSSASSSEKKVTKIPRELTVSARVNMS